MECIALTEGRMECAREDAKCAGSSADKIQRRLRSLCLSSRSSFLSTSRVLNGSNGRGTDRWTKVCHHPPFSQSFGASKGKRGNFVWRRYSGFSFLKMQPPLSYFLAMETTRGGLPGFIRLWTVRNSGKVSAENLLVKL